MTTRPLIFAAALAAALTNTPAMAEHKTVAVSYADLDLATEEGMTRLQERLDVATRKVCRVEGLDRLRANAGRAECMREAQKSVAVQVAQIQTETQRGG